MTRVDLAVALALLPALLGCRERGTGTLSVVSFPRGVLVIDGRVTDERTPISGRRIPAGEHTIGISTRDVAFEPQTVTVRSGRTSHLYFRSRAPSADLSPQEICAHGRPDHCIARIEDAIRSGDPESARRLTRMALAGDPPEGYGVLFHRLLNGLGADAGPDPYPDE